MKIYGYQVKLTIYKQAFLYFVGKNDKLHRIEIVIPAVQDQADRYINSLFGGGILYKFANYSEAEDHYADTLERIRNMQSPLDLEIERDKYYNERKNEDWVDQNYEEDIARAKEKRKTIRETMANVE